jgi:hypothetical protein
MLLSAHPLAQPNYGDNRVYGSAKGMAIAVHTPVLYGTPVNTLEM